VKIRRRIAPALAAALLLSVAPAARSDRPINPLPRIFASSSGNYGFRVTGTLAGDATGTLFTLDREAREQPVWSATLVCLPGGALVSDEGYVITVDDYISRGNRHALVIYDPKGTVLADYALDEMLPAEEIERHVPRSVSSRHWANPQMFAFEHPAAAGPHLAISFPWGRQVTLRLRDGSLNPQQAGPAGVEPQTAEQPPVTK
jgi:hypothetical protein